MDCVESSEECRGVVESRPAPSGSGYYYNRCEGHDNAAHARVREVRDRYPDSALAPSWFDPSIAGETWDDDY